MQISISDIAIIVDKLLTFAKDLQVEKVEIPVDFYWNIDDKELYNMADSHKQILDSLGVGSLEHEWEIINRLLSEDHESVGCTTVDFIILASLLRAIGNYLYDSRPGWGPKTNIDQPA